MDQSKLDKVKGILEGLAEAFRKQATQQHPQRSRVIFESEGPGGCTALTEMLQHIYDIGYALGKADEQVVLMDMVAEYQKGDVLGLLAKWEAHFCQCTEPQGAVKVAIAGACPNCNIKVSVDGTTGDLALTAFEEATANHACEADDAD